MKKIFLLTTFLLVSFSLFCQATTTDTKTAELKSGESTTSKPKQTDTVATVGALIGLPFNTKNGTSFDDKIDYWQIMEFGVYSNISVPLPKDMIPINILVDFLFSGSSAQVSIGLGGTLVKEKLSHGVGFYYSVGGAFNRGESNDITGFKTGAGLYYHLEIKSGFSFLFKSGIEYNVLDRDGYSYDTIDENGNPSTEYETGSYVSNAYPVIYFGFGGRV